MKHKTTIATLFLCLLFIGANSAEAESPYTAPQDLDHLSENASLGCDKVNSNPSSSTVARILCRGRDGAAADWDLNSVLWSLAGVYNEIQKRVFDQEQDRWRASLNSACSVQVPSSTFVPSQQGCVIRAFHSRATALRSLMSGDALIESKLSPEDHAKIQLSLIQRGLLQDKPDGEFGATTRQAIKRFQSVAGEAATGFLTKVQSAQLLADNQPQLQYSKPPTDASQPAAHIFDGTCRGFPEGQQVGMLVAPEAEIATILEGEGYVACQLVPGSNAANKVLAICAQGSPCEVQGTLRVHDFDVDIVEANLVKSSPSWKNTCYGAVAGVGDGIYSVGVMDVETSNGSKAPLSCNFFSDSISKKILAECPEGSICEVKGRFEKKPEIAAGAKEDLVPAVIEYVDSVTMKDPPTKARVPEPQRQVDASPNLSTPISLCSAAINDPLRPMIIDSLISGGKHIAPGWTQKIKDEIESDYGSFLKVRDDATVERVDDRTGKIGCAVTYEANLQGLAGKVLEEGASARAQILIRQMVREGSVIARRLAYTVQKTSGGSLMTWFGLTAETPSLPQRRAGRCMVVLGGRCMVWDR
jgi:Putative peptidoglycan binding domain